MPAEVEFRVAILGGGAAGLSAAKFLTEEGVSCKVFEAAARIGGKSESLQVGKHLVEMGTCYTTLEHRIVKKWLRDYKQPVTRLGEARFDGAKVVDFVKKGGGSSLPSQAVKFIHHIGSLRERLTRGMVDQDTLDEASMTTLDWIRLLDLPKIELALYRLQTAQGYGRLDDTAIGQTALWCTPRFIASGVFNRLNMPDEGWSRLWERVAEEFEVELNSRVSRIVRSETGVDIIQPGRSERFDMIICAIPVDQFNMLTEPTEAEQLVARSVTWTDYTTSLVAVEDWFTDHRVSGLSAALAPGVDGGKMIGGRYEGYEADLGGHLYVTGQVSDDLTPAELAEILEADIEGQGARLTNLVTQRVWRYFPRYEPEAVRQGLLGRLQTMQGEQRTWYTGATFSHELISSIVQFNARMTKVILSKIENAG